MQDIKDPSFFYWSRVLGPSVIDKLVLIPQVPKDFSAMDKA